jgi:hypothetical protein
MSAHTCTCETNVNIFIIVPITGDAKICLYVYEAEERPE